MPNSQQSPPQADRDLLIRLDTKFESMKDSVTKLDKKLDDFNIRLDAVVKDIKDELKNDYVTKQEIKVLVDVVNQLKSDVSTKYTPLTRFDPVESVYKDVAKRVRTMLLTVGLSVVIAAASAPTWIAIYKNVTSAQTGSSK